MHTHAMQACECEPKLLASGAKQLDQSVASKRLCTLLNSGMALGSWLTPGAHGSCKRRKQGPCPPH